VIEFGSGASTVRLAEALPDARIVSVEHDAAFLARSAELVRARGFADRVELLHAPLGYWRFHGRLFFTYTLELPRRLYDAVLIDGPPGYLITGRQACLHRSWPLLRAGGLVVLDDYHEPRERRAAARWRATYAEAFVDTEIEMGHGLLVLEKLRHVEPAPPTARDRLLNLGDNLRSLAWRGRRRLGALRRR
jgi:predicted O-methyltransferase YrrM